mmetsp:Transcript_18226/g.40189  ORF Transcript_18226/g.40189 Transcript_18226/m.40189 type:complete len:209 (+) Transcript_18226:2732-3358(+)
MEVAEVLLLPGFDLLLLADGELRAQLIGLVQTAQGPGLNAVLHVVHLLHLSQHCLALLLDTVRQHLWSKGDLVQGLERREVHTSAILQLHGCMDVVDGMLEIRQRIGARASTDETFTFSAPKEANVLHHMGNALLIWILINAANVQLNVRLKALRRHGIAQNDIAESIGEHTATDTGMQGQGLLVQSVRARGPVDEAALRRFPVGLPV